MQNQSFSKRSPGKGCKPSSPCCSSHDRVVLALWGGGSVTNPFLKQTPKSNLILCLGVDKVKQVELETCPAVTLCPHREWLEEDEQSF